MNRRTDQYAYMLAEVHMGKQGPETDAVARVVRRRIGDFLDACERSALRADGLPDEPCTHDCRECADAGRCLWSEWNANRPKPPVEDTGAGWDGGW